MPRNRILIVDDEYLIAKSTQLILEEKGFDVEIEIIAANVIAHAARFRPDLILMDVFLDSGSDGIGIAAECCGDAKTPVLFISGHPVDPSDPKLSRIPSYRLLNKPCDEYTLTRAIDSLLAG